jgi:hypothetical protein
MKTNAKPAGVFSPWIYDTRVQNRYLADGIITAESLTSHLAALPDVSDKSEQVHTLSPGAADGYDDGDDEDQG